MRFGAGVGLSHAPALAALVQYCPTNRHLTSSHIVGFDCLDHQYLNLLMLVPNWYPLFSSEDLSPTAWRACRTIPTWSSTWGLSGGSQVKAIWCNMFSPTEDKWSLHFWLPNSPPAPAAVRIGRWCMVSRNTLKSTRSVHLFHLTHGLTLSCPSAPSNVGTWVHYFC